MRTISIFLFLFFVSLELNAQNKFSSDTVLINIYKIQNDRNAKGLLPYLSYKSTAHRYAAVIAFASVQDSLYTTELFNALVDPEKSVRSAAAISLGQLRLPSVTGNLIKQYHIELESIVKGFMLEAIGKCGGKTASAFIASVNPGTDSVLSRHLVRGAYYLYRRKELNETEQLILKKMAVSSTDAEIKWLLTGMKFIKTELKPEAKEPAKKDKYVFADIKNKLKTINNPYRRLDELKQYNLKPEEWIELCSSDSSYPVRTFCMESFLSAEKHPDEMQLTALLSSGDVAVISLVLERVRQDSLWDKSHIQHLPFLNALSAQMMLPRDFETFIDIHKTIAQLEKRPFLPMNYFQSGYRNDINWEEVSAIPQNIKVKIKTNKGEIILECKVNEAPGSVANFIRLVKEGYYNGKYFHRMVPNFVVQGGCPRGDGWGSLNWNQRSEFSNELTYKSGSVGLASSGKDTEGVQFFITHTYTAHLDGRYTIFAEVISGMEVVNTLTVGDVMLTVEVL